MPRRTPPNIEPTEDDRVLRIRKYPNRRLYDQTRSRTVRQEELCDLVVAGHDVEITDSRTGEDITNLVLAQALIERDPTKLGAFPPALLHLLVRTNERLLQGFMNRYFSGLAESFLAVRRQLDALAPDGLASPAIPATPFDWAMAAFRAAAGSASSPAASPLPSADTPERLSDVQAELRRLRREIAELRGDRPAGTGTTRRTEGRRARTDAPAAKRSGGSTGKGTKSKSNATSARGRSNDRRPAR